MTEKITTETLTSVKVSDTLMRDFKTETVLSTTNFKQLVNASLHKYTTDPEFKEFVDNYTGIF